MDNAKIELRNAQFGYGLFAKEKINAGEEIAAFDGPLLGEEDVKELDANHHAIQIADDKFRDSLGFARLANHSCDPNCGIKEYTKITAMRDINPGEEITWDYEMTEDSWLDIHGEPFFMQCGCGSPICRKQIGAYPNMPQAIRDKYKGFISEWLLEKYEKSHGKIMKSAFAFCLTISTGLLGSLSSYSV